MQWQMPNLRERQRTWRRVFAFFPVRIHESIVWLEFYWYRGNGVCCDRARTLTEQAKPYSLVSY